VVVEREVRLVLIFTHFTHLALFRLLFFVSRRSIPRLLEVRGSRRFGAADKIMMFLDLPSIIDWMLWHLRSKCAFLLTQRRPLSNSCQFLVFLAFAVVFEPAAAALGVSCLCDASTKHILVGSGFL
jgi:hypothetical protein